MKVLKSTWFACLAVCCAVMTGCNDELAPVGLQDDVQEEVRVIASMGNDSRTTYRESKDDNGNPIMRILWESGDAIGLYTWEQTNLKYVTQASGGTGEFKAASTALENAEGEEVYAYYPYNDYVHNTTWDGINNSQVVELPKTRYQTYQENKGVSFYYAKGQVVDNKLALNFKSFYTTLRVKVPVEYAPTDDSDWTLQLVTYYTGTNNGSLSGIGGDNYFNFVKEVLNGYSGGSPYIDYSMPKYSSLAGKSEIDCHVALLPQDEGVSVDFYLINEKDKTYKKLATKEVPEGGLNAGYVYSVNFVPDRYESKDFELKEDEKHFVLNQATVGKGINLVFVGEGFVDKDMEPGGLYETRMKEAVNMLFSIEPYSSYRDRFNIYGVKVVSKHGHFMPGAEHVFEEEAGATTSEGMSQSDYLAFECMESAKDWAGKNNKGWNADQDRYMVAVIYNTTGSEGRSYAALYSEGSFVAYMMEGVNEVLIHEVGGHGIAHLLDEYVEPGNEALSLPEEDKAFLDKVWDLDWGWGANVDYRLTTELKWYHMCADSDYKKEVAVYEGSYLYGKGAYRPTANSMMNANMMWFNAPSREAIYMAIMTMSEGDEWLAGYKNAPDRLSRFKAVDKEKGSVLIQNSRAAVSDADRESWSKRHRPPLFIEGSWRGKGATVPFR